VGWSSSPTVLFSFFLLFSFSFSFLFLLYFILVFFSNLKIIQISNFIQI
jgi:hypothetical protein